MEKMGQPTLKRKPHNNIHAISTIAHDVELYWWKKANWDTICRLVYQSSVIVTHLRVTASL